MTAKPERSLSDIATHISGILRKLERDEKFNPQQTKLYEAGAARAGRFVQVYYVRFRGHSNLYRDEAERYLAALEGGFRGRHEEALRGWTSPLRENAERQIQARQEGNAAEMQAQWAKHTARLKAREDVLTQAKAWRSGDFSHEHGIGWHEGLGAAVDALLALEGAKP